MRPCSPPGLGYRMCTGSILANRELYLIFIRLIHCFQIEKCDGVDFHPVLGDMDPTSLVAMPQRSRGRFMPRNEAILWKAIEEFVSVEWCRVMSVPVLGRWGVD